MPAAAAAVTAAHIWPMRHEPERLYLLLRRRDGAAVATTMRRTPGPSADERLGFRTICAFRSWRIV